MAIGIQRYNGTVITPDSDYPDGDIKDNTGANDGTDINRISNADIQQFFAKLMRIASILPNGLFDNEYNDFQFIEAAKKILKPYGEIYNFIGSAMIVDPNFNPLVNIKITPTSPSSDWVQLGTSGIDIFNLSKVRILNNITGNSLTVIASGFGDIINGGTFSYTLAANKIIELVYDKANTNWIITYLS